MDFHKGLAFLCLGLWSALGADASSGARAGDSISFTRSGSDQLSTARRASGSTLSFTYEPSYGQMMGIADQEAGGFSLSFTSDALLHLPISQRVTENGVTLLSAAIGYDAQGLRASRTVSDGSEGDGSSTTNYWYGGALHPLVVERDGASYRLIGKGVVEQVTDQPARAYLHGDHLGSVRMVTNVTRVRGPALRLSHHHGRT
jgi:hypothetical protein